MPAIHYHLPHPGQAIILNHPARFRVVACGRRFGKTELAKLDAMLTAVDGGQSWWVLPTYTMAQEVWGSLMDLVDSLEDVKLYRSDRLIEFPNGGLLAVKSGHEPDRLRGAGLNSVVIDEAAYCHEEVWHALRPALSDQISLDSEGRPQHARALLLSTPRGHNWFWGLYQKGLDPLEPEWISWRMPTQANPLIPAPEIQAAQRDLPTRLFTQEYLAEFTEDSGAVFSGVRACIAPKPKLLYQQEAVCFGVDWGRMNDYTVVMVLGMESKQVYEMLRLQHLGWAAQRAKLTNLAKRWQPHLILAEANSIGGPNIEALQSEGLPVRPFTTTHTSKSQLIDALALALEERSIRLLDDPVLIHELEAYQMERLAGGDFRYSAPQGGHDDCVMALALALHASRYPKAKVRGYL